MVQVGFDNSYARDLEGMYLPVEPQGFAAPKLLVGNDALFTSLGLPDEVRAHAAAIFSGSLVPEDATPLAMAYAGHQFGGFNPQLGDGRALLLGEVVDPSGARWDIHLKGSGPTPFSRGGDGFAGVGPVLREYLISEAMAHLNIPTTRILAAIRTGETIYRRTGAEDGAVLARIAQSHLRVGTFEYAAARRNLDALERLVAYALERHGPLVKEGENAAHILLESVAQRQAELIASWMSVGFIHGVMNTDNFSISGETIDFGPCAFMDVYDPATVFSSIDRRGRYAYANQPHIGKWNLARLGEALLPLISDDTDQAIESVHETLHSFSVQCKEARIAKMCAKIALTGDDPRDEILLNDLLDHMKRLKLDYTNTFRGLASALRDGGEAFEDDAARAWEESWRERLEGRSRRSVAEEMDSVNPVYIPRNHLVEEALEAAEEGDLKPFEALLHVLEKPFEARSCFARYACAAPDDFGHYVTYCGT